VEATRGIRGLGLPSNPAVVAQTANALEGDRERLLAAGMDGYMSKPVTLAALNGLLDQVALGKLAGSAAGV
jgi:CheY-like chemotaxis protein